MQAWRVRYWTASDKRRPIEVTGMVMAPREALPPRPRKTLASTHSTWGVVEKCAPSHSAGIFKPPGLAEAIARGYVVVAPDYPGLGSTMPHPYLGGIGTANAVFDAVRAARGITGAASGSRFVVWGEPQGGHAALWTASRAGAYAGGLPLLGAAAAAPPTDLPRNLDEGSDPTVKGMLTALTAYSWSQHYGVPLKGLSNFATPGVITRLAKNNCISLDMKPRLSTILGIVTVKRDMRNTDLGSPPPWSAIASSNSALANDPGMPMLITQNPADKIVAPAVTLAHARKLCRNGARLTYRMVPGKGHETSAADAATATLDWLDASFAGQPAPSSCGRLQTSGNAK